MPLSKLLTLLADSQAHHVTELAHAVQRLPQQLNILWQQTPDHIRGLLRQKDGYWRLIRPLALLPESYTHPDYHTRVLAETTSSNDELLKLARQGQAIHQHLVVAHHQSAGRGRQGKTWQHRMGECLMFSVGWTFSQAQAQLGALALVVALACQKALHQHGCPAQIKWPNDLVIGLNKLGGILIETVRHNGQTHAVIGIGINFVLPKEVEHASSFQASCNSKSTTAQVLDSILNELSHRLPIFNQCGFAPFQAEYEQVHRDHHQEIHIVHHHEIVQTGTIMGIADNGALILQTEAGEQHISSGEVSLRRPEQILPPVPAQSMRYLLLDGGNSRLKWAWVENGEIIHTNHSPYRDLTQLGLEWAQYGAQTQAVMGSAVCGEAKQSLVSAQLPHVQIEWLSSMKRGLGIYNHYQNIEQHGADRWFNVLGSRRFTQNACIVMSCGTAVTCDALTADNHYLGGTIMPGFHLMKESLALKTANLNQPIGKLFPFPTTTANALAGGMMDAVCGSLMIMHARLKARIEGGIVDVVITGGGASKVAKSLPETFVLDNNVKIVDNLVIFGLLQWLEQGSRG